MSRIDGQADLRRALVDAGHLIPTATQGLSVFTSSFEAVLAAVERLVHETPPVDGVNEIGVPPLLAEAAFVTTGYVRSFPQLIGSVDVFAGTPRDHGRLLADQSAGHDWTEHLTPAHLDLVSAPCHSTYPLHSGQRLDGPRAYEISSRCWRHEPSDDPFRLMSFRMREKVCIGTPDDAQRHRRLALESGPDALRSLGLAVDVVVANDPFFGRTAKIFAEGQREDELKHEFVCDVFGGDDGGVALGSANYHQDHFGVDFDITSEAGEPAHSSCVGFGLERVTLALFATHGMDCAGWPEAVRGRLRPVS